MVESSAVLCDGRWELLRDCCVARECWRILEKLRGHGNALSIVVPAADALTIVLGSS